MGNFSEQEYLRYTRHLQLPGLGNAGQQTLKTARVLVVGCGGLGAPVSLYLAGAGIGHITLVDGDTVALSNLHRQVIYTEADVGQSKALASAARLRALNSDVNIEAIANPLTDSNVDALVSNSDLVLDCTDNVSARLLLNQSCIRHRKPWLFASVYQYSGQCALFLPGQACYQCLYPEPPTTAIDCNSAGVLGVVPGLLGTLQASEAQRFLCGLETSSAGHLLLVESQDMQVQRLRLNRRDDCPACTPGKPALDIPAAAACANPVDNEIDGIDAALADPGTRVIDVRSDAERAAFNFGGDHLPLDQLSAASLGALGLPSSARLLFYCQSGVRSARARDTAQALGYRCFSLRGGIAGELQRRAQPAAGHTQE